MTQPPDNDPIFYTTLRLLARDIYDCSTAHGFHGGPEVDNVPTKLMLIVSELAEAMEAHRNGMPPSDKIPDYGNFEEELADAVIRILDLGVMMHLEVPGAILMKHRYNKTRPYLHGGKAY